MTFHLLLLKTSVFYIPFSFWGMQHDVFFLEARCQQFSFFFLISNTAVKQIEVHHHLSQIPKIELQLFQSTGFFCIFVAYLSSHHEKAINALYELAQELPAICLPHQNGGIPLSAFPNGTTSKLAGFFSTLSL